MMSDNFANQIQLFAGDLEPMTRRVIGQSVSLAYRSVTVGSAITGAPGQPVDTSALLHSWVIEWKGPWYAEITSDLPYAHIIEAGIGAYGPLMLRSKVGGWHSLKLTAAGWPRIVAIVIAEQRTFRRAA
jgi:hypothetical protein